MIYYNMLVIYKNRKNIILYYIISSANVNLHKAKDAKNDEFYTQLSDIEKKLNELTRWFTNLDVAKRHEKLTFWKPFTQEE